MHGLNYQHLFHFWTIVLEGSLTAAATRLRLRHSTLSAQLRALESALGGELFERRGKRLVLTPLGTQIGNYAAEIFRLGSEVVHVARGGAAGRMGALHVGVVGNVPKSVVVLVLEPVLRADSRPLLHMRHDRLPRLVDDLVAGRLNLILSDAIPEPTVHRVHSRVLGDAEVFLYGTPALQRRYGRQFPGSLDGAPVLLPGGRLAAPRPERLVRGARAPGESGRGVRRCRDAPRFRGQGVSRRCGAGAPDPRRGGGGGR